MKSTLDINSLDEHAKARVLGTRICKGCGQTKPAREFAPRVAQKAKRGTAYIVFRPYCKACRAAAERLERAANRKPQYYDRTPERIEKIISLAAKGYSNKAISKVIKCNYRTLPKHFGEELSIGRTNSA